MDVGFTLDELTTEARIRLEDTEANQRWPDEFFVRAFGEAEREAALRARLLIDDETPEVVEITLVPGQSSYSLHPSVFAVDSVYLDSTGVSIVELAEDDLDHSDPYWRKRESSAPTGYIPLSRPDFTMKLRFFPTPTVAGVAHIRAYRLPLYAPMSLGDMPEIAPRHHEFLIDWVMYRCYNFKDPDKYDPAKAKDHLATFTEHFGERPSANTERKHREVRRETTASRGIL